MLLEGSHGDDRSFIGSFSILLSTEEKRLAERRCTVCLCRLHLHTEMAASKEMKTTTTVCWSRREGEAEIA